MKNLGWCEPRKGPPLSRRFTLLRETNRECAFLKSAGVCGEHRAGIKPRPAALPVPTASNQKSARQRRLWNAGVRFESSDRDYHSWRGPAGCSHGRPSSEAVLRPAPVAAEESALGAEPDLFADTLWDVVTGEEFPLADFSGRLIVLETMDVWCPLCTSQQEQLKPAREKVGDDVVFVSVDTDPNENGDILSRYVEK